MSYDIIGDVHGQADKLVALLSKMGYRQRAGAWRHPDRQALFVGDLIDRGPGQCATVDLVRSMVDAGQAQAVMGNHEFNAIAWHLEDPDSGGRFLRPRHGELGERNRHQHAAFLAEVEDDAALHREYVDFFLQMPLWLELPRLRVVHACWHAGYMAALEPLLAPGRRLTRELMVAASRQGSTEYVAVEGLTKGLEVPLPPGHGFHDKDGHARQNVRIRWWDDAAASYRTSALLDPQTAATLPDDALPFGATAGYDDAKLVFFGHYWLTGTPGPLSPRIACVDYSAGKGGPLIAYRWDGEETLDPGRFVA
jgi:hypothetical protein